MQYNEEQDTPKKIRLSVWKKLLRHALIYKKRFILIIISMSVLAACDALSPLLTRHAIDYFVIPRTLNGLGTFISVFSLIKIIQLVSVFVFIVQGGRLEAGVCYSIRREGFAQLQSLPFAYFDRTPVGHIMSRMTSDVVQLGEAFAWVLVDIMWATVYLASSIAAMFLIDLRMAVMVMLVMPPLTALSIFFQQKILKKQREVRKVNSKITNAFNEGLMGAKTSKTLVLEQLHNEEFTCLSSEIKSKSLRSAMLSSVYLPLVIFVGSVATAYVLTDGGHLVLKGLVSLGTITAFVNYTINMFDPIHDIAATLSEMQRMQAAAERVVDLLETEADITDTPEVIARYGDTFSPKKENWPKIHGNIDFEHVTFRYKNGETVLKDFNLHVNEGETVALVGPTGAGKSTIVNLLCRFYEPTEGSVKIDGVDYRERSQLWLQSNLGYVLQDPHLFSGTVRDNIRYARPGASDEEVQNAARLVHADAFIMKLEKGYDTDVGEAGSLLSTGEKQLISFARALLSNPALFVLDEATSSVDTETEAAIQRAITVTLSGRTSFMVAHRLSTIRGADKILYIDGGRIAECGTHAELMQKKGAYWALYTNQFIEEESKKALNAGE